MHQSSRNDIERPVKKIQELEAEAVAYVVSLANGVDCQDASCDYIRLYQGDETLLAASLERIRITAVEIIELIDEAKGAVETCETSHLV